MLTKRQKDHTCCRDVVLGCLSLFKLYIAVEECIALAEENSVLLGQHTLSILWGGGEIGTTHWLDKQQLHVNRIRLAEGTNFVTSPN